MPNFDEIDQRVQEIDAPRTAKRKAACKTIKERAGRRAALLEELAATERDIGDALATASDVMDVNEAALITEVPASDLNHCLAAHQTTRTKRKRSTSGADPKNSTSREKPTARTPRNHHAQTPSELSPPPTDSATESEHVAAEVA
ncbi:hypothetical protein [Kutzneria sp. NPDC051319]|uniref:hypothetical protein n=1 Tax=Kutzneria sp. NPDC051319 TaxID=3155047 RepID=UPI0034398755